MIIFSLCCCSNDEDQRGRSVKPISNGTNEIALLGELDVAFLAVHALGMYFIGQLVDRMDLPKRYGDSYYKDQNENNP